MANKKLQEETLTTEEKLVGSVSNFFSKNRLIIIIALAVIVVGIVLAVVLVNISTQRLVLPARRRAPRQIAVPVGRADASRDQQQRRQNANPHQ